MDASMYMLIYAAALRTFWRISRNAKKCRGWVQIQINQLDTINAKKWDSQMQVCTHLSRFALVSRVFPGRNAKKYTGYCIIACVPMCGSNGYLIQWAPLTYKMCAYWCISLLVHCVKKTWLVEKSEQWITPRRSWRLHESSDATSENWDPQLCCCRNESSRNCQTDESLPKYSCRASEKTPSGV